jgi:outer membrane lipoprotein-sorting protein
MESKIGTKPVILFLFVGMMFSTSLSAQTNFEQLRAKFENGQIFQADFSHTYLDSYTQESTNSSGNIWINAVGYKLISEQQTIVVDGELSQVYDSNRNRVIISEYEPDEDDFAPSRMLSGIDETYTSSESTLENGNFLITLETNDDFAAFITVEIELGERLLPLKITAYDIADNIIITTFSNGAYIEADTSIFEFTYPEDAEIVDMRY